ncbi:YrdB family protein [Metabacillus rhizolycopersici]|uniref:YrdB family protein n=1 Tax=Metabacillus rhizolycopersici TaxID=2875709 RepID=A0ABS7UQM1_9BACI|nr:YrdB family protein [Metabacillus rhizolycopersici]MBZ5750607.1 YrdB family protein [Metabacillus rhizolycopersici]
MNQYNLLLRFLLEIAALFSIGMFAWTHFNGFLRYALVFILPALVMIVWGVFAVPGDPSRSGEAVVVISGFTRLMIEFIIFSAGFIAFFYSDFRVYSFIFLFFTVLHYLGSSDRIKWLLGQ